jgi:hypothetical protein
MVTVLKVSQCDYWGRHLHRGWSRYGNDGRGHRDAEIRAAEWNGGGDVVLQGVVDIVSAAIYCSLL